MLKIEGCGKQREATAIPGKSAALVPEFAVKDLLSAELEPRFCACSEGPAVGQNTDGDSTAVLKSPSFAAVRYSTVFNVKKFKQAFNDDKQG